jgi:NADH-dependent peroxiredoxin subunit F
MRDLIILGGGPAGCTAGIYSARKKLDTLLISKDFIGQVGWSSWVENYPGFKKVKGVELAKSFVEHLKSFDIDINSFEKALSIKKKGDNFLVSTDEAEYESRAVIIATGAMPKKLNVENEEKFRGKGISYCVTCDGAVFEDREVVVVGGGNAGLDAALELTRFAKHVYLLEALDELTADQVLVDEITNIKNIEVITSASVQKFEGDDVLEGVKYTDLKQKKEKVLKVEGCFIEIGTKPNTEFLRGFVELSELDEVVVNPKTFETSVEGVFAAGDVVDFPDRQIVIAAGQGSIAAISAFRYLTSLL